VTLASVVVTVRGEEPARLDPVEARKMFLGRAAQAIFLDLLGQTSSELAMDLHAGSDVRPYAIGAMLRAPITAGEPWQVRLRFSALSETVQQSLAVLVDRLPECWRLDGLIGARESVAVSAVEDADAGQSSYQEILNRHLLDARPPESRFSFRLVSPTTFHQNGRNLPVPLPRLVFGGLVDRWNAFSRLALSEEVRRYAEECLVISQYRLESRVVDLAGGRQIGAVGMVTYRSLNPDPYWLRVLAALADFSFFAGIGAKTTMGLGQTRPRPVVPQVRPSP